MDMMIHSALMSRSAMVDSEIMKFLKIINFKKIADQVEPKIRSRKGRAGFPVESMIKATFLGNYYDLSDRNLAAQLQKQLDFGVFCGMYHDEDFPDYSTLCDFRNTLVRSGLLEEVLDEFNSQFEAQGLKVEKGSIAIVDATVIQSAARPMKKPKEEEVQEISQEEAQEVTREEVQEQEVSQEERSNQEPRQLSKDPDATFHRRGNTCVLGYKKNLATDEEGDGEKVVVRPVNESECINFDKIADPKRFDGRWIYSDKGSASKKNRDYLKEINMKSGIMHKASSNKPLSQSRKTFNRLISKKRWRVEQSFGILKRKFNCSRARYMTIAKVAAEMIWKTIFMNTLKASNKLAKQVN